MTCDLLVFGANGQLGREMLSDAGRRFLDARGLTRADADITDQAAVERAIATHAPHLILNAAAYTAVDRAESEPHLAHAVNVNGARNIARGAAAAGIPIIHISTDYVFDGTKDGPYHEGDLPAPLGVYGRTKAEGEAAVRLVAPRHIILRTSWVFGRFGRNFLKSMLRLSAERDRLRVVEDQHGCPTATVDIVEAVFAARYVLAKTGREGGVPFGTYHFAGSPATTWHGFASAIVAAQARLSGRCPLVEPIATADYLTLARRPPNSELDSSLFVETFGYRACDWRLRVRQTVEMLLEENAGSSA